MILGETIGENDFMRKIMIKTIKRFARTIFPTKLFWIQSLDLLSPVFKMNIIQATDENKDTNHESISFENIDEVTKTE